MKIVTLVANIVVVALLAVPAHSQIVGPVWVDDVGGPGAGGTDAGTGNAGKAGGATWTYTNFDTSDLSSLFWAPANTGGYGLGLSYDGAIDGASEIANAFTFSGNVAAWTGETSIDLKSGNESVLTRMEFRIFDLDDNPIPFAFDGGYALGAWADVHSAASNGGFYVEVALFGEGIPFLDYYDSADKAGSGSLARSSINDGFFYEIVPEPSTYAALALTGLFMVAVARRRRPSAA